MDTIAFFGALPFYLSNINLNFTDSFLSHVWNYNYRINHPYKHENSPPGYWCGDHFYNGSAELVIVMAIAIFPMLSVEACNYLKLKILRTPKKLSLELHHLQEEYLLFIQF